MAQEDKSLSFSMIFYVFFDKFGYDSMTFYKFIVKINSDSPTAV